MKKIAIIGGGNLGTAIAEGLVAGSMMAPDLITITKRNTATLNHLAKKGFHVGADNREAAAGADIVILAVKPFQAADVLNDVKDVLSSDKIIVSVVTGFLIENIEGIIEKKLPLFRAMPNTAIAIRQSMTCLCSSNAGAKETDEINNLFTYLGKTIFIDEKLMDAATVLGACGTAYAMRYIRANIQGGIEIGFDAATAHLIATQTIKGAAEMLLVNGTHPEAEIDKVTTPKGCTIAGLNEMEHQGFSSSLIRGLVTSYNKIVKG